MRYVINAVNRCIPTITTFIAVARFRVAGNCGRAIERIFYGLIVNGRSVFKFARGTITFSPSISISATRNIVSASIFCNSFGKDTTVPIFPKYGARITLIKLPSVIPVAVSISCNDS